MDQPSRATANMKPFIHCLLQPRAWTPLYRAAEVANFANIRRFNPLASSAAARRLALLSVLAVLGVPSAFIAPASAQESPPPATTLFDPDPVPSERQSAKHDGDQPPRPRKSTAQPQQPVADTPTGLSSSSWSNGNAQLVENHELSVEPGTSQLLPDDAPAWVGSLPDLSGDVHRLFVGGNVAESAQEAAEGLDFLLVATVNHYVDTHLLKRDRAAQALAGKITASYVRMNLVDDPAGYIARLNTPGQPMFQKWVTLSITPEQRATILRWDREALQRERLAPIGLGLVSLLGGVGLLHLILRKGNR